MAFGYSHLTGGYAGGQAEYVRVPFSDVGPSVIPDGMEDDTVLFLSDILPTRWLAAENAQIERGAMLMGAEQVKPECCLWSNRSSRSAPSHGRIPW